MNRAELYDGFTGRMRPLPEAVSFDTDPAAQRAAALRLEARARATHTLIVHEDDPAARARLVVPRQRTSRPLPAPKCTRPLRIARHGPPARKYASIVETTAFIRACTDPAGLTAKQICAAMASPQPTIYSQLKRLIKQGHVWIDGKFRDTHYHAVK